MGRYGLFGGSQSRVQVRHGALIVVTLLLVVGGDEERHRGACDGGGGLDNMGHVAVVGLLVEVLELRVRVGGVLGEVVVATVGDALQLVPAPREQELHVGRARAVVAELVGVVGAQAQQVGGHAVLDVPVVAGGDRKSTRLNSSH